jgi:hypothetical protein
MGSGSSILGQCGSGSSSGSRVFDDQKLENFTAEKKMIFLLSKLAIYLSLGLQEGLPSYRRILEPPALKNMEFLHFFLFTWEIFALLDPDLADQNQ